MTGRHRLPEDWQPERLRRVRIVRSDDGVELFEAITDEEA